MSPPPLDLALVAHGRFHTFDLARALLAHGLRLKVLTNYPRFAAARFGLPPEAVVSCPWHGVLTRYLHRWNVVPRSRPLDVWLHRSFSRWAARQALGLRVDAVNGLSGVALEVLQALAQEKPAVLRVLTRGSSHIRAQYQELMREGRRAGQTVELPALWMVRREMREYAAAQRVQVLSTYARETFVRKGHDAARLHVLPLGSEVAGFRASPEAAAARVARVLSGAPLRVLCTGSVSLRKGLLDVIELARRTQGLCRYTWVGRVAEDAAPLMAEARQWVDFVPHQPQSALVDFYNAADVFLLATVEDGFAMVLEQARANGLPILATRSCAAPDLVEEGITGWVLPSRRPDLFAARLEQGSSDRPALAAMARALHEQPRVRDWAQVARDYAAFHEQALRETRAVCV